MYLYDAYQDVLRFLQLDVSEQRWYVLLICAHLEKIRESLKCIRGRKTICFLPSILSVAHIVMTRLVQSHI